ncbi:CPBP family intramembrane metalloprotease [bacterium]|nr:CPBP family intramembrane metalloprotease [bacterium]
MLKRLQKTGIFVAITFSLSWGWFYLFSGVFKAGVNTSLFTVMATVYMFMPMLAAIIVQKFIYHEPLKEPLGISFKINRWFFVAWLLPIVLVFAALGMGLLMPGVEWSWEMEGMYIRFQENLSLEQIERMKVQTAALPLHPLWIGLLSGLVAGATINAVAGFGEELGWRGLLQKELGFLGFWRSSLLIGLIWGIWHTPIILQGYNYPQHPQAGVFYMVYFTMLYAPIFSYIRLKARSVIAPAILHGSLNATVALSFMTLKGGTDLSIGLTGLAGLLVLLLANIGLYIFDRFLAKEPVMAK